MDTEKTIIMPKRMLKKWLTALRSGRYKQGQSFLHASRANGGGFCCLGVLQKAVDGKVERRPNGESLAFPTEEWMEKHGIKFLNPHTGVTTKPIMFHDPWLPTLSCTASTANDDKEHSFNEIADAIEACAEGV